MLAERLMGLAVFALSSYFVEAGVARRVFKLVSVLISIDLLRKVDETIVAVCLNFCLS